MGITDSLALRVLGIGLPVRFHPWRKQLDQKDLFQYIQRIFVLRSYESDLEVFTGVNNASVHEMKRQHP